MTAKVGIFLIATTLNFYVHAQDRTLGGLLNSSEAFEGYTLFAPAGSTSTFLINNCGEKVHEWPSSKKPGNSVYLQNDGSIFRAGQDPEAEFGAPGLGGYIEHIAWNGDLLWSYKYSSSTFLQHHDFHVMPNGNVLILAWDVRSEAEAIAAGRDPLKLSEGDLWSELLVEVTPVGTDQGEIVWEWYLWDHLIQDFDDSKENFGDVSMNPQKVDINYTYADGSDWIHANSVNYSEENDYIIISTPFLSEFWIINHNISSEEAKGAAGDLIYRWGNEQVYQMGDEQSRDLFFQHTVEWIPSGLPNEGKIILFNNGRDRTPVEYSSVLIVNPFDATGDFSFGEGKYGPDEYEWEYTATIPEDFYASFISGAQMLPNGNVLINNGPKGDFFEVNADREIVWNYVNPISSTGITYAQGDAPGGNLVFRATKYPVNHPGLLTKDLSSKGFVENDGILLSDCLLLGVNDEIVATIFPNPATNRLIVKSEFKLKKIEIFDLQGRTVEQVLPESTSPVEIQIENLKSGLYVLTACLENDECSEIKFLKK